MRRTVVLMALVSLALSACGQINEEIVEITNKRSRSPYNAGAAATGLMLAMPPVNTILINSCKEELFMDPAKRPLCNLNHQIRGTTPAWERSAAEARLMAYQPGELQCTRTLGTHTECRVISGMPRPVTLISTNLGSN